MAIGLTTWSDMPAEQTPYFEGTIYFEIELEPYHPELTEEYLSSIYGTSMTKTVSNGNIKKVYENGAIDTVWYLADENREYTLMTGDDELLVSEGRIQFPAIVSVGESQQTNQILDLRAEVVDIEFADDSVTSYWFSRELKVDREWFKEYRIAGFDAFYNLSGAIILGYERRTEMFRRKEFVTGYGYRAVKMSEFALPDLPVRSIDGTHSRREIVPIWIKIVG